MAIILASASPRRQELLKMIVPDFEVEPAEIDESSDGYFTATDYVLSMAQKKAQLIYKKYPNDIVIGCDTIVVTPDGEILGKPADEEAAFQMLSKLNGVKHQVYTSVFIIGNDRIAQTTIPAEVEFFDLTPEEIREYLATGEYQDKAGAYGIQEKGALLVKKISGDYYAIVGLPVAHVARMLRACQEAL